ncbi:uncharacterized protein V6R79_007785 [Siganus canaliculatus]
MLGVYGHWLHCKLCRLMWIDTELQQRGGFSLQDKERADLRDPRPATSEDGGGGGGGGGVHEGLSSTCRHVNAVEQSRRPPLIKDTNGTGGPLVAGCSTVPSQRRLMFR